MRMKFLLMAFLLTLPTLSGCGDSAKVDASHAAAGPTSQAQSTGCASGERYLMSSKNPDQVDETVPPNIQYLERYGFYNPIFCADISDQMLTNAAQNVVRQYPHICDGMDALNGRRTLFKLESPMLKDAVAAFNQATKGGPRGAFMPDHIGDHQDGIIDAKYRQKHPIEEDMPPVSPPPVGVTGELANVWGVTATQKLGVEYAAEAYCP